MAAHRGEQGEEVMTGAPIKPGDVLLGKYRVERVLGRGGMGIVLAARHLDLDELFAIKFLLPDALDSADAVSRFLREARASARLKGEHVAKVHDVGQLETGAPYMVMEHLEGVDMKALVKVRGPLEVEEAATLLLQACDALAEAHAVGIIHRDIKPANLFVTQRPNGTACVKVLDFGISKVVTGDSTDLTESRTILGTPLYMSPEQMTRMKDADARSDVWSIGVVLYELVTGVSPFKGESPTEVIVRVLQEEPPPPSQVRAGLPAALDALVMRCLQKRPDRRFQSAQELAEALYMMCGGHASSLSRAPSWVSPKAVSRGSRPGAEPPISPIQGAISTSMPAAGSAWDRTFTWVRFRLTAATVSMIAALILTTAGLAIAYVWFVRGQAPGAEAAPQPRDSPPAASVTSGADARGLQPANVQAPSAPGPGLTEPPAPAVTPTVAVANSATASPGEAAPATASSAPSATPPLANKTPFKGAPGLAPSGGARRPPSAAKNEYPGID
jgi:serine/threonine-protein kinase